MSLRHMFWCRFVSLPLLIFYNARVVTLQSLANCPKTHPKTSPYLGQSLKIDTNPSAIPGQSLSNPSPIPQLDASISTRNSKWREDPRATSCNMEAPSCNLEAPKFEISLLCWHGQKTTSVLPHSCPTGPCGAMSKANHFCKRVGKLRHKASTSWWLLMPSTACFSLVT